MENKSKISVEIPKYLKDWINNHDPSQNALTEFLFKLAVKPKQYLLTKEMKVWYSKSPFKHIFQLIQKEISQVSLFLCKLFS